MRKIEEKGLGPMHMRSDLAESPEKFAHDDELIEARDPKPARDHPKRKNRERGEPGPPSAPNVTGATLSAASQLENQNSGQQERVNDRPFDQHSRGQQTKHDPPVFGRPRLLVSNFLPDQESDQTNHQ